MLRSLHQNLGCKSKSRLSLAAKFQLVAILFFCIPKLLANESAKVLGDRELASENYTEALKFYKSHLKSNPKDIGAKVLMGVAYLYSGEPNRALVIFKSTETTSPSKALNFFHQALAQHMLGDRTEADKAFVQAARYQSKYGDWSIYELAVRTYNDKDGVKAKYWADLYTQRYPSGKFIAYAKAMLNDLRVEKFNSDYPTFEKPNLADSTMKFHPYSLSSTLPHFWYWLYGYHYVSGTKNDPTSDQKAPLKQVGYSSHALMMHFGAGLGPMVKKNSTTYTGYLYRQNWLTDDERISDYFKGGDAVEYLTYLPFRADLLERQHQFFVNTAIDFNSFLQFKINASQRFTFMGARLIPGPEGDGVDQNASMTTQSSFITPALRIFSDELGGELYLNLNKTINKETKDFSNQTYSLASSTPVLSGGLRADYTPKSLNRNLSVNAHLIMHDFIFNDYFNDYSRQGLILGASYSITPSISILGELGVLKDDFKLSIPKQSKSCSGATADQTIENPLKCKRQTNITTARFGASWRYSRFSDLFVDLAYVDIQSPNYKADTKNEIGLLFGGSFSFPEAGVALKMEKDIFDTAEVFLYD